MVHIFKTRYLNYYKRIQEQVIKNNKMRKDKNLWTARGVGDKIKYYRAYNEKDEAQYVIRKIKELIKKENAKLILFDIFFPLRKQILRYYC